MTAIKQAPDHVNSALPSEEELQSYYSREHIGSGGLLAHGWGFGEEGDGSKEEGDGSFFYRRLGGRGTPFVSYDLTIKQSGDAWIPYHGSVAMAPHPNPADAANALMDYWHSLSLRDRLAHEVYAALGERKSDPSSGQDHALEGPQDGAAKKAAPEKASSGRSFVLASFSLEHGHLLYWQRSGVWSYDSRGAVRPPDLVNVDFNRMLKTRP